MDISKIVFRKFDKSIKKELKLMRKENKRCAKLYPDWKDDEFNMGHNKFIWGYNPYSNTPASFHTWNDAEIIYNRLTNTYNLKIDLFVGAAYNEEVARMELDRLMEIEEQFRIFLINNELDTHYNLFPIIDLALEAPTLEELYARFCILLDGYKQYRNP